MPALLGYMIAIVVTLGGYMIGLHWLLTPPDPFMPDPRSRQLVTSHVKHEAGKPRSRLAAMAPIAVAGETPASSVPASTTKVSAQDSTASTKVDQRPADPPSSARSANTPTQLGSSPTVTPPVPHAAATTVVDASGNAPQAQHLAQASYSSQRSSNQDKKAAVRKGLAEGRQLQVMILRTYQSADGRRFTRLIPLREAERNRITRQIALAPAEVESSPFGFR